jgi:hypothetical protein
MAEVPVTQRERSPVADRVRTGEEGGSLTVEQVRAHLAKYVKPEYVQLCHVDLAGAMLYVPLRLRLANSSFIESAARMSGLRVRYCEPEELRELRGTDAQIGTHVKAASSGRDTQEWARQLLLVAASYGASDIHLHRTTQDAPATLEFAVDDRVYIVDDSVTPAEMDALMGAYVQGLASAGGTSMKDTKLQHAMIGPDKLPPDCGIEGVRLARGGCYPVSRGGKFMTLRLMHEEGPGGRQVSDHLGMRLRVPSKPTGGMGLASLGYFPDQIALIDQALEVDTGIIVVGGPTGSGKSTMLWETLVRLRKRWPYRRVVTAENPPERKVPGAVQLEIGGDEIEVEEQTAAFREAMRMMLRMAPHVILVGEIREGPIGRLAIEMSTAGHLIMTTIHANNASVIVPRLEMTPGFELPRAAYCTPDVLRLFIAQRLIPRVCPACSVPWEKALSRPGVREMVETLKSYGGDIGAVRFEGPGCEVCDHKGTAGKIAVAEVVPMTEDISEHLRVRSDDDAGLKALMGDAANGFMGHRAMAYVLRGITDPLAMQIRVGRALPCRNATEKGWVDRALEALDRLKTG